MSEGEDERMVEWLRRLGCPIQLTPEMLASLNTPTMRPVWRHLQQTGMPVGEASLIRRNVLRTRLRDRSQAHLLTPSKAAKFKIESIEELAHADMISKTEHEIVKMKSNVASVDKAIEEGSGVLLGKMAKLESLKLQKKEIEDKTVLLQVKANIIKKDSEKLEGLLLTARGLNMHSAMKLTPAEVKHNTSVIARYVASRPYQRCNKECSQLLQLTTSLSAPVVYNGILHVANRALKSFRDNMDINIPSNVQKEKLSGTGSSFSKHLRNLKALVLHNEIDNHGRTEQVKSLTKELQTTKATLEDILKNTGASHNGVVEFVGTLADNTVISHKIQILRESQDKIIDEVRTLDYFKQLLTTLGKKDVQMREDLRMRVDELNRLTDQVYQSEVTSVRAKVHQRCADAVSAFLAQQRQQGGRHVFTELERLMKDDIEMFYKTPLIAMTSGWEQDNSLVLSNIVHALSNNEALCRLLLRSQPTIIIRQILELICFSQAFEQQ